MNQITSHNSGIIIYFSYWSLVGTLFLGAQHSGFHGKRANTFVFPILKTFLDIGTGRNCPFIFELAWNILTGIALY